LTGSDHTVGKDYTNGPSLRLEKISSEGFVLGNGGHPDGDVSSNDVEAIRSGDAETDA
jgi:hypothetical protein